MILTLLFILFCDSDIDGISLRSTKLLIRHEVKVSITVVYIWQQNQLKCLNGDGQL